MKQTSILDLIEEGQRLRDQGIQQAADHADQVDPGWNQKAFNEFVKWLEIQRPAKQFKGEDFRIHCKLTECLSQPSSDRAFGGIIVRAAKAGLIKKVGFAITINPKAHGTPASLWQKI